MADLKKAKMGHLFTGAVAEGMCPGGDVLGYYLELGPLWLRTTETFLPSTPKLLELADAY